MKDGKKKPFYKRWWVWIIAVIIVIGVSGESESGKDEGNIVDNSGGNINVETQPENQQGDSTVDTETKSEAEEVKPEVEKVKPIKSGTYKVGSDLAPGEYLFFAKGMGYVECTSDSTGSLESIVFNDNVKGHLYLTVNEGEYLKITGGEMYPVAEAPSVVPEDGLYKDGMYKVGQDIPGGEYKIILTSDFMGYYEVRADSRHDLYSIITNENVQGDTYLTIQDGQYIKLNGVQIQK